MSDSIVGLKPKTTPLKLESGSVYHLSPITYATMVELEDRYGVTMGDFDDWMSKLFTSQRRMAEFAVLLAQDQHPDLTFKELICEMLPADFKGLMEALSTAFTKSFSKADDAAPLEKAKTEKPTKDTKKKKVQP